MSDTVPATAPARRTPTARSVAIALSLSALAGVITSAPFTLRFQDSLWRGLLFGVISGLIIGLAFFSVDVVLGPRIDRLPEKRQKLMRAVAYMFAGPTGFFFGFVIGGWIAFNRPFFLPKQALIPVGFAALVAGAIGIAIYTYERLKERLAESLARIKEQEYAEKELELARTIQKRLLPPEVTEGNGFRVEARNVAARFVAGDYYDVFHLPDGTLGLVIADVSGKGIGASLIMSTVKSMVPLLAAGKSVAETLGELNSRLSQILGKREFVALAYLRYDPATATLRIGNAGLPDPLLIAGESVAEVSVEGARLPLAAMKMTRYSERELQLPPGGRLLLFTDGLPEASDGVAQLGYTRLQRIVSQLAAKPTTDMLDALLSSVHGQDQSSLDDDCTMLVVERTQGDVGPV